MTMNIRFPDIVAYDEDGKKYCYRHHYTNKQANECHTKFMNDQGWYYTGKCRFNSGNGSLHIYERKSWISRAYIKISQFLHHHRQ